MDDTSGWGENGGVDRQPGARVCDREHGEQRTRFEDSKEYLHRRIEIGVPLIVQEELHQVPERTQNPRGFDKQQPQKTDRGQRGRSGHPSGEFKKAEGAVIIVQGADRDLCQDGKCR